LMAGAGWLLTRFWKNPHVASVVWLAVLLKLVTPPVVALPVAIDVEQFRTSHSGSGHSDPLSRGREVSGEGSPATSPHALQPSVVGAFETQAAIERTSDSLVPGPAPLR